MVKRIFVTATNTNIGKTYTTKLLLKEFASRGLKVGVLKPIETGVESRAFDAEELLTCVQGLNPKFNDFSTKDIAPIVYRLPAAPFVASNAKALDLDKINEAVKKIEKVCDILIIEGAGGLYVPIDKKFMMIDLISYLNAKALLVTHCSLGCINDTLLSQKALQDKNISYQTAFNCKGGDEDFKAVSEPYFFKSGFDVLKIESDIEKICDVLYNFE